MSHFGVDVAPHIPMLFFSLNQLVSISDMSETNFDSGLTLQHSSKRTLPLELFFPQTNKIRSCCRANSLIFGMRLATCLHIVS